MDAFLRMAVRDRRLACLKVTEQKRLQAASVDKDFWVCWTLREMFNLPDIGSRITFKGGTSLYGVSSRVAWQSGPPQTSRFLPESRTIARFSFGWAGWIMRRCAPVHCV